MAQALDGIRILDLGNYIAGPFAAMLLADMGAAVVKMENTGGGDPFRKWGQEPRMYSPLFRSYNRNKRSMTLNLRDPEGKEIFLKMAGEADVVIENFPPGGDGPGWSSDTSASGTSIHASSTAAYRHSGKAGRTARGRASIPSDSASAAC